MLSTLRSHRLWFVGVALAGGLALPASTLAATIYGTSGPDDIYGTSSADTIYGLGGNDRIDGRGGGDAIDGGANDDRIYGGYGNDRLHGRYGNDKLVGGPGSDGLSGGYGNDRIYAAGDGTADVIRCGPGTDYAVYGPTDTFADGSCEYTSLRAS